MHEDTPALDGTAMDRRQALRRLGAPGAGAGLSFAGHLLGLAPALPARAATAFQAPDTPASRPPRILPGDPLSFPRDFGAHPAFRTEWWYITGTLNAPLSAQPLGFQITFFRSRVDAAASSHSRFATHQLVFAHAALSDIGRQRLLHDQRIARAGFGLAEAQAGDTRLSLRDWTLQRRGPADASVYTGRVAARDFALDLRLAQTQPLLLQGEAGFSQKGPRAVNASHYYSQPHLAVQGQMRYRQQTVAVQGQAWLDHEWGETLLAPDAVGWDWLGINLKDGGALTAFRIRGRDGGTLWCGGSLRHPGQPDRHLSPQDLRMTPGRIWVSPASSARYPVNWTLDIGAQRFEVRARLDQQELDSRLSTGNIYWEGLSDLLDAGGQVVGTGYLEMTGYAAPMSL
jgi:predicted secreted hydrolase